LPFKCNLHRYNKEAKGAPAKAKPRTASVQAVTKVTATVGGCDTFMQLTLRLKARLVW
jgi:hypothetical protein